MADETPLSDVEEMHLRSALCYALQNVKLPRRRTSPPFDMNAEAQERDAAARAIIEQLKLNKWRVVHRPLCEHFNPDPHPDREPSPTPGMPSSARPFTLGRLRGHLTELRVACPLCNRQGVYSLEKQIAQHGAGLAILDWLLRLTETCPVRAEKPAECAAGMVDMEKVLKRLR
jgi:hypothetical protein